jgi:PIF1-like helicase/Helicase
MVRSSVLSPFGVMVKLQVVLTLLHLFGGVTVVFGGDFKQILPVVVKGAREAIVGACLRRSKLWRDVEVLHLVQNMRLNQDPDSTEFAQWLLKVGSGEISNPDGTIKLLEHMICGATMDSLIDAIYSGIANHNDQYFLDRAILAPRNDDVFELNEMILARLPGEEKVYFSADTVIEEDGSEEPTIYPAEYLQSIVSGGLPLAHLKLKVGAPVMLLCNISPAQGLCNGSRMIVAQMKQRVIEVRLLGGDHAGQTAFIPRITMSPSTDDFPLKLQRRQFPLRLAFAMTINKSQGQSLTHVGLNLQRPVFSHGQLYVALSRCTTPRRIKVLLGPQNSESQQHCTTNIVYPEVLLPSPNQNPA